jgi:hypothetical protein
MTVPTNTFVRSAVVGEREDLEDSIYRVAPEETPFSSNIGKMKIKNILHEWQTETLDSADADNAQYEGDDVTTATASHTTTRVNVYAQIFRKDGSISGTVMSSDRAGRADELDYQKVIRGIELRRDMEARFIGNKASVAETPASVTRKTAGALAWVATNDSLGATGSSGGWTSTGVVAAATNGTQRTFTETLLKGVLVTGFTNGAKYSQAYMSGTHKQIASAFTGIADIRASVSGSSQATIYGAADSYVSDFGQISFIPHPYGLTRDVLLIDPSGWSVGTYRGVSTTTLAKNGDNERWMTIAEKMLICKNQLKGAAIRDLT